jgi:hypothetical protein
MVCIKEKRDEMNSTNPNYVTLPDAAKLELLREHTLDGEWPDLDHKLWCLHCQRAFDGHSVRVWQDQTGRYWLECGTPNCDGCPIDWAPYPWWDPDHPLTRTLEGPNGTYEEEEEEE